MGVLNMCNIQKPRFRVDEPVYVKMNGYSIPGHIKTINTCHDSKDGIDRMYYIYGVDDEQGYPIHAECTCITEVVLVERWEK